MSRAEYQRAQADLLRLPQLCQALRAGTEAPLDEYQLSARERARLLSLARHPDMTLQCMLYRASRLVGVSRRLPASLVLLGPSLRSAFDAYVVLYPDASAEFDQEAQSFAEFLVSSWLERSEDPAGAAELRAILALELKGLERSSLEAWRSEAPQRAVGSRTSNRSE